MSPTKVTVIGHVLATPYAQPLPPHPRLAAAQIALNNYTRVTTEDGLLLDHLAWLKRQRGIPDSHPFTLWEMYQCSALLLSSHLRRHGVAVQMVNYIDTVNKAECFEAIAAFAPDIIAVSTTFVLSAQQLAGVAATIRTRFPDTFLVAGGHHVAATLLPLNTEQKAAYLNTSGFDAMVEDFQGEGSFLALANAFPGHMGDVPNLLWRTPDGGVAINERALENNDINDTPIDFDDVPPGSVVHIRTARSCSFKCAFCSYPSVAGPLALMDFELVKDTLRRAKAAQVGALFFVDDTFNVPPERFEALLDWMIAEDINIPWYSFLRCQYVNEALVQKMRQSGCLGVFLGIESGSDKILKNMKKGAVSDFYRRGIRWLKEAGIITVGAFIVGFPGETNETVEETRRLIDDYGLDFYFLQPFYYLHHTPIAKRADEFNLTGKGLFWQHATMNHAEAFAHINHLFSHIKNSTFVNPDYTLWEIAYLRSKNLSLAEIVKYRKDINDLTLAQMARFGSAPPLEGADSLT